LASDDGSVRAMAVSTSAALACTADECSAARLSRMSSSSCAQSTLKHPGKLGYPYRLDPL
jgi:hypothetical protein